MADPAVIIDENGILLTANVAFEEATGLNQKKLIGKPFSEIKSLPAESKKLLMENLRKRIQGLPVHPYEIVFKDKNGKARISEINAKKFYYDKQLADLVVFRDITDRKKAEEALRRSEAELSAQFYGSPDLILILDRMHRYVRINRTHFLSYNIGQLLGKDALQPLPPDQRELARRKVDECFATGKIQEFEHTLRHGEWVRARIVPLQEQGTVDHVMIISTDITKNKKVEENLRQEHYKLEAVANSIGAGFAVISKDYRIVWANKYIKESKGDVEGKRCYAALFSLNNPCPKCGVKKVFEQDVLSDSHEYKSIDAEGNPYWVELIATPIKDAAGKVETAVEVCIDITEKKNLQSRLADYSRNLENIVKDRTEQLRQAQDKLVKSERFAAIGELAGMVGHDLRNPLTGIKNAAYFIRKKLPAGSAEALKDMFKIIDNAIVHADKIVNDLLEYSREIELDLAECTPKSVVEEALSLVNVPSRVRIVDKTQEEPLFKADKHKLARVFVNLLKNAIEAIPTIGNIKIKSARVNGNVEFSFADTGIGMPKEKICELFSPLVTTKAQGMGFGLAICKRMVEAHQGKITVDSTLGKGTTVTVILPLEPKLEKGDKTIWVKDPDSMLLTTTET